MAEPIPKSKHHAKQQHESNSNGVTNNSDLGIGGEEEMMTTVPPAILKRVNALKNIQTKLIDLETKFYEELHQLECKYAQMYEPYYVQREKIVNGEYEPNEEEAKWALDEEEPAQVAPQSGDQEVNELAKELEAKADIKEDDEPAPKGIVIKKTWII